MREQVGRLGDDEEAGFPGHDLRVNTHGVARIP
jgi:hypothetical protein